MSYKNEYYELKEKLEKLKVKDEEKKEEQQKNDNAMYLEEYKKFIECNRETIEILKDSKTYFSMVIHSLGIASDYYFTIDRGTMFIEYNPRFVGSQKTNICKIKDINNVETIDYELLKMFFENRARIQWDLDIKLKRLLDEMKKQVEELER